MHFTILYAFKNSVYVVFDAWISFLKSNKIVRIDAMLLWNVVHGARWAETRVCYLYHEPMQTVEVWGLFTVGSWEQSEIDGLHCCEV